MKYGVVAAGDMATRFLRPGDAVLEIGAADGEHTCVYATAVGSTGHVLAVEPHAESFRLLRKTCRRMPWVHVHNVAVDRELGTRLFQTHRRNAKCSSLWPENVSEVGEFYPVTCTTVDALVQAMPRAPRLIHVDAQGAEAEILAGAARTLALPIVWVMEVWPAGLQRAGSTVAALAALFDAYTYTPRHIGGRRMEWAEIANPPGMFTDIVMVPEDLMEAEW